MLLKPTKLALALSVIGIGFAIPGKTHARVDAAATEGCTVLFSGPDHCGRLPYTNVRFFVDGRSEVFALLRLDPAQVGRRALPPAPSEPLDDHPKAPLRASDPGRDERRAAVRQLITLEPLNASPGTTRPSALAVMRFNVGRPVGTLPSQEATVPAFAGNDDIALHSSDIVMLETAKHLEQTPAEIEAWAPQHPASPHDPQQPEEGFSAQQLDRVMASLTAVLMPEAEADRPAAAQPRNMSPPSRGDTVLAKPATIRSDDSSSNAGKPAVESVPSASAAMQSAASASDKPRVDRPPLAEIAVVTPAAEQVATQPAGQPPHAEEQAAALQLDRVMTSLMAVLVPETELDRPAQASPRKAVAARKEKMSLSDLRWLDRASKDDETSARSTTRPSTPAADVVVERPSVKADAPQSSSLPEQRLSKSEETIPPGQTDRVMASLSAVLMPQAEPNVPAGVRPREAAVATHAEKVLASLETVRTLERPSKADRAPVRSETRTDASAETATVHDAAVQPQAVAPAPAEPAAQPAEEPARHVPPVVDTVVAPAGSMPTSEPVQPPAASASPTEPARSRMGEGWQTLAANKLDGVRGGFITDNGLKISFGIERAVYINGNLVATTSLNIADLGKISAGRGAELAGMDATSLALIQSGKANTFNPSQVSATGLGTVIQNTLNDQKIQNVTVINATVNSMQILRSVNLQSAVRGAVADSLRR